MLIVLIIGFCGLMWTKKMALMKTFAFSFLFLFLFSNVTSVIVHGISCTRCDQCKNTLINGTDYCRDCKRRDPRGRKWKGFHAVL